MSKTVSNKKELHKKLFGTFINKDVSWANDPVVVKKTEEAKEFIKKHGLPKELTKRKARPK